MDYIPHTDDEVRQMLKEIGVSDFEELLVDIPRQFRARPMQLPPALDEQALRREVQQLAEKNHQHKEYRLYLGAGAYQHFVPSAVQHLLLRGEFFSAYTPYQPEASQGTLQAMYEYQSLICELTGMDVSNASLYDGATAAVESMLLSLHHKPEARRVLISETVHPDWRQVLATYARSLGVSLEQIPMVNGVTDQEALSKALQKPAACMIVQNPNFLGCLENLEPMGQIVHDAGGLFVVSSYPTALGLLKPPSEAGADIVVGEGQCLGGPIGYGGPYLGIFACKDFLKRRIPGRIVGQTVDRNGKRGYVLTMQAREQHIRREKATSNICTNQSLLALTATMYLSALGKEGFHQVARTNAARAGQLHEGLTSIPGVRAAFDQPFFNEFTVALEKPVKSVQDALLKECFIAGLDLNPLSPALKDHLLLCATETKTEEDIEIFVKAFARAMRS